MGVLLGRGGSSEKVIALLLRSELSFFLLLSSEDPIFFRREILINPRMIDRFRAGGKDRRGAKRQITKTGRAEWAVGVGREGEGTMMKKGKKSI